MHSRHSSNDNDYKDSPDNIRRSASDHKNGEITVKTLKHWHLKVLFLTIAYFETIVIVTWLGEKKENPDFFYNMPLFIQFQNIYEANAKEV